MAACSPAANHYSPGLRSSNQRYNSRSPTPPLRSGDGRIRRPIRKRFPDFLARLITVSRYETETTNIYDRQRGFSIMEKSNDPLTLSGPDASRVFAAGIRTGLTKKAFYENVCLFLSFTGLFIGPMGLKHYWVVVLPAKLPNGSPLPSSIFFREIADVGYASRQAYKNIAKTNARSIYSPSHGLVFDMREGAFITGHPDLFDGNLEPRKSVSLVNKSINAQEGTLISYIGLRDPDQNPYKFVADIKEQALSIFGTTGKPKAVQQDAAKLMVDNDWVLLFEHWPEAVEVNNALADRLADMTSPVLHKEGLKVSLPVDMAGATPKIVVTDQGECFDFQFARVDPPFGF